MRWLWVWMTLVVGVSTAASIYQWAYDQIALGPGWVGHVFANRTGKEVLGLELVVVAEGVPLHWGALALGGALATALAEPDHVKFTGDVVPEGLVVVALPQGAQITEAVWLTKEGHVPIDVESPIPRAVDEDLGSVGPELLRLWEDYPYLVVLDARRSFSPVGAEIVAWMWRWEDGLIQSGSVIVRGFTEAGIYRVRLTIRDNEGREQSLTVLVSPRIHQVEEVETGYSEYCCHILPYPYPPPPLIPIEQKTPQIPAEEKSR